MQKTPMQKTIEQKLQKKPMKRNGIRIYPTVDDDIRVDQIRQPSQNRDSWDKCDRTSPVKTKRRDMYIDKFHSMSIVFSLILQIGK